MKAFNNSQMANNKAKKKKTKNLPVNSKGKLSPFSNKFLIRKDQEDVINLQPAWGCGETSTIQAHN